MKRNSLVVFFALAFVSFSCMLSAQMPNFFGTPAPAPSSNTTTGKAGAAASTPQPRDPDPGRFGEKESAGGSVGGTGGASEPTKSTGPLVPSYDPAMDNHIKAPEIAQGTGLFGLPVKQVEDALRYQGAKNHSYAFGKYSRMVLSAYLVTIYFDRQRKVGGFLIEPREPYKTVEPGAREFFMQTFLKGADMSKFVINMASDRLEVQYAP
ncbi:MAG: hypothetical protein PHD82_13190 [Candidatus Riflebacteria bacterium]|nr:hypothetical protein [Candidatus Riflebacteria bacterium]